MIIKREEALAVFSFKLAIEIVKILLHIIELNKPMAIMDHMAIKPLNAKAMIKREITINEKKAKILVLESLNIRSNRNCRGTKNKIG